ncbi:MAG: VanZ family protein [Spirochaetae bacterium HGW-Spirochaetae-1]|jgi:VanZ family protein|nr:MAG: VanZ family protein [Spirochaetae bacterium HGW-Spirochaetae-1]
MHSGKFFRIIFWLANTGILVAALIPSPVPGTESINDKILHGVAFFVLSLLGSIAYKNSPVSLVLYLAVYGFLIELIQYFLPYRTFALSDLLADIIGIILFLLGKKVFYKSSFMNRSSE